MDGALTKAEALAVSVLQQPNPDLVKQLAGLTAEAIRTSPEVRQALSEGSLVTLSALRSAADTVLSTVNVRQLAAAAGVSPSALAFTVGQQALALIAANAPQWAKSATLAAGKSAAAASEALQDVAAAGGAFTAALTVFWGIGDALSKAHSEQMANYMQWMAAQREEVNGTTRDKILMAPDGSGANGAIVPSDLFPYVSWWPRYTRKSKGKPLLLRPLIGSALIKITESGLDTCPPRPNSDVGNPGTCDLERPAGALAVFEPVDRVHYGMYIDAVRKAANTPTLGIPEDRRRVLRLLRRAIEAQRGVTGSDGGLSLWPLYMDLLADAFERGWLTEEALDALLHTTITWDYDRPREKFIGAEQTTYRPSMAVGAIIELVRKWKKTVRPTYSQDMAGQARQLDLIARLSRVAAAQQMGKPITAAMLEGIPSEVAQSLRVTVRPSFLTPAQQKRAAELRAQGLTPKQVLDQIAAEARPGSPAVLGVVVFASLGALAAWALRRRRSAS